MADKDSIQESHNYHLDIPMKTEPFGLRGSNSLGIMGSGLHSTLLCTFFN